MVRVISLPYVTIVDNQKLTHFKGMEYGGTGLGSNILGGRVALGGVSEYSTVPSRIWAYPELWKMLLNRTLYEDIM